MKKAFVFLPFFAVLAIIMSSCSKPSNAIVGSWKFSYLVFQGQSVSASDIKSNPALNIIFSGVLDARLVFNDNGTVVAKLYGSSDDYTYVADDATKEIRIYDSSDNIEEFTMFMTDDLKYIYFSGSSFIDDGSDNTILNEIGNIYFEKE